ncbi:MAG TPA: YcaO-like family protein [Xanthomonadaceae bacterium]|jgi:ribosomal protein S12 methylthiotransferase accessory factor|nr:YcaO-like family protein [Xanthomonadaceae bacterium]
MLPFERTRTLSEAQEVMQSHIEKCGWTLEFQRIGTGIVTTHCTIRDSRGEIVNSGFGKGDGDISTVGALYEAVEHHHGLLKNIDVRVECVYAGGLYTDPRFATLPFLSEFHRQADRLLGCAVYQDFQSGAAVRVPMFLIFPGYLIFDRPDGDDFDYSVVMRYSTNSGTAIGATFEEAAIHALNEIVERDAWSLFLLSHFMAARQKIGRVIDNGSLPGALQELLVVASERASGRHVSLIDITSDIGIPTFVATVDRVLPGEPVYPHGFGTSTYAFYAAYRAVTELIQDIDFKCRYEETTRADRLGLEIVSNHPKFRDCVYFKVDECRLDHGAWQYADLSDRDLKSVLADTLFRLESSGIDVCFNVNRAVADTFCVVSCVSMALERFFLVTGGHLMGPGMRGKRLFASIEPDRRDAERMEAEVSI